MRGNADSRCACLMLAPDADVLADSDALVDADSEADVLVDADSRS